MGLSIAHCPMQPLRILDTVLGSVSGRFVGSYLELKQK